VVPLRTDWPVASDDVIYRVTDKFQSASAKRPVQGLSSGLSALGWPLFGATAPPSEEKGQL